MPYLPGKIPLRGWLTDSPYSAVPDGYTDDMLNVMPSDVFRRRIRLGMRPASNRVYSFSENQNVQCMIRTISFNNATTPPTRKDRLIIVAGGKFYYLDPDSSQPIQITNVPAGNPNTNAVLSATVAHIEGVQRGRYAYFVDGSGTNGYVKVDLLSASLQISYWHHGSSGPEDHVTATVGANTYTATLISQFGSRIVLAGVKTLENIWYLSNTTDPDDWNPSGTIADAQAGTASSIGPVGDEIVAMSPLGTSGFLFAGKRSLSYLTADPVFDSGARMASLSKTIGAVGTRAICEGPEKTVYLLGQDGLYRIRPNDFDVDRGSLISLNRLDSFFSDLKYDKIDPVLHYDVERRGVWIFLTRTDAPANSTHLFYSEQVDGFFPMRFYDPLFYGANVVCQSSASDGRNQIMLAAYKNTISCFDQRLVSGCDGFAATGFSPAVPSTLTQKQDQLIESRVSIGPILAAQPSVVFAKELQVELADDPYNISSSLKSDGESIADRPQAIIIGADTPQLVIAENLNTITVEVLYAESFDGGDSAGGFSLTIDGGSASNAGTTSIDGAYAKPLTGIYITQDSLQNLLTRKYYTEDNIYMIERKEFLPVATGSFIVGNWYQISTAGSQTWTAIGAANNSVGTIFKATGAGTSGNGGIAKEISWLIRFKDPTINNSTSDSETVVMIQESTGETNPDEVQSGTYRFISYRTGSPQKTSIPSAAVRASKFDAAEFNYMGYLREGINNRMRCRFRYGVMYVRIESTGWPWVLERVAMDVEIASARKSVVDVNAKDESNLK
jgi:hypothetical protein